MTGGRLRPPVMRMQYESVIWKTEERAMSGKTGMRSTMVAVVFLGTMAGIQAARADSANTHDAFANLGVVDDNSLERLHGRDANITYNVSGENNLNASIDGSTITAGGNITSGEIGISGNAMQNFSGLSNFVANSGNNNNLQASMVVNVTLQ
jgi:hypothetical protein